MDLTALIDADIVAYRCAAVTEGEHESVALFQVDELMKRIVEDVQASGWKAFLTGKGNFRYLINPEYKANRVDKPKPTHLPICRDFLVKHWDAVIVDGYEADDALGANQTDSTVLCSIDKDLLMIPGTHYNFVKNEFIQVDDDEGLKHFWKQMLIGDSTDNIRGIDKIGKVKAGRIIDPIEEEEERRHCVYELYNDDERFRMNADCLWIMRTLGETWTIRNHGLLDELGDSSPQQFEEVSDDGLLSFPA